MFWLKSTPAPGGLGGRQIRQDIDVLPQRVAREVLPDAKDDRPAANAGASALPPSGKCRLKVGPTKEHTCLALRRAAEAGDCRRGPPL